MFDYSQLDLLYGLKYHVPKKKNFYNTSPERPWYKTNNYCLRCQRNKPKKMIRCDFCNKVLRIGPTTKKHTKLFEGY